MLVFNARTSRGLFAVSLLLYTPVLLLLEAYLSCFKVEYPCLEVYIPSVQPTLSNFYK